MSFTDDTQKAFLTVKSPGTTVGSSQPFHKAIAEVFPAQMLPADAPT
eukprot:CAMPEP_0167805740 /NCGR_PEP_ID=MMETSP0111_2-20121227/21377_1 /TAXON_ID=91324 /ORGANISM="Lotharella globosa, Strain CCCM811" /LENGTH=46 /DNA_ID= /DNA_START= /DNA_END= /DNA_ORIENTATION=